MRDLASFGVCFLLHWLLIVCFVKRLFGFEYSDVLFVMLCDFEVLCLVVMVTCFVVGLFGLCLMFALGCYILFNVYRLIGLLIML